MEEYSIVYGTVRSISRIPGQCCQQMLSLLSETGVVNFVISPDTYVVNGVRLRPGMNVAAFYDRNMPVPLIYPPQFRAAVVTVRFPEESIMLDVFDRNLLNSQRTLRLNIAPTTDVITSNGQTFSCDPGNKLLLVFYSRTTRSIPAQTTPHRVIVMCGEEI